MKLRPINKKGQVEFSPMVFFGLIVAVLILAPIILKVVVTVTGGVFTALNSTSPSAVAEGQAVVGVVVGFFDYLILIGMTINMILLFISAFFIDTKPVFVILYILFAFILVVLAPSVLDAVDKIWLQFPDATAYIPYTDWMRSNLVAVIVSIIVLTGIIMYGKMRFAQDAW